MARLLLGLLVLRASFLAESQGPAPEVMAFVEAINGHGEAKNLDFKAEFKTSFNCPVDFEAHGHLAYDQSRGFFDFEFNVDKGIKEMEKLMNPHAPSSFNDALNGNELFSFKARISDTKDFSLGLTIGKAGPIPFFPPESDTLCVNEDLQKLAGHAAQALRGMPPDSGESQYAPHPNAEIEQYEHDMPHSVGGAERETEDEFKDVLEEAGPHSGHLQLPGLKTFVLHLSKFEHDAMAKIPQEQQPDIPAGLQKHPPPLLLFTDIKEKRLSKIQFDVTDSMQLGDDAPQWARDMQKVMWFNITSMDGARYSGEEIEVSAEPVCQDGVDLEELAKRSPPQRRLGEGPMKLHALETLSKVFRVTKVLAPANKNFLPSDATQLWNAKDRDSAIIERDLAKHFDEAEKSAPVKPSGNLFMAGIALLVVSSFAIGVAMGRRRPSTKGTADIEELLGAAD